jgi:hypothetical protein
MVIFESAISHRAFRDQLDPAAPVDLNRITLGLAKGGAVVLFAYFFVKLQGLAASGRWDLLATGWGAWYLVEVIGLCCRRSSRSARLALARPPPRSRCWRGQPAQRLPRSSTGPPRYIRPWRSSSVTIVSRFPCPLDQLIRTHETPTPRRAEQAQMNNLLSLHATKALGTSRHLLLPSSRSALRPERLEARSFRWLVLAPDDVHPSCVGHALAGMP